MKELYNGLPDLLTQVAHEELEKLPGVSECNITYLPQVGRGEMEVEALRVPSQVGEEIEGVGGEVAAQL